MPLITLLKKERYQFGVWRITESLEELKAITQLPPKHHLPIKEIEHQASRALLLALKPDFDFAKIWRTERGKPHYENDSLFYSLTHSYPYVAAAISKDTIGVDIQVYTPKVVRIQSKFLTPEEQAIFQSEEISVGLAWSAKEAMFKWTELAGIDYRKHLPIIDYQKMEDDITMVIEFRKVEPFQKVQLIGKVEQGYEWMVTDRILP